MKRVIAAVLLLGCAVGISFWTGHIFKTEMNGLLSSLNVIIDSAETDTDEVLTEKTEVLLLRWYNTSEILHSLVMHEGMDDVEENITALPLILEHSDREEFKSKCIEAINQIENLLNAEKLSFENIL